MARALLHVSQEEEEAEEDGGEEGEGEAGHGEEQAKAGRQRSKQQAEARGA